MDAANNALENIKHLLDTPKQSYWGRLKDAASSMDVAQTTFVMSQESVKESYKEMMKAFTSFLFEKYKEDFAAVPSFQPIVDKYINAVTTAAQNYGQHAVEIEEENKRLKKELEELRNANRS